MTLARAVQLPAFALLASLLIVAGPDAGMLTLAAGLAIAGLSAGARDPPGIFRLPAWAFRSLALRARAQEPAPRLARAWWAQSES